MTPHAAGKMRVKIQVIDRAERFSRMLPQAKLGPGPKIRLNAAGKRAWIAGVNRKRSAITRTEWVFLSILAGALTDADAKQVRR